MTSDELRALADAATPGPWWLAFYTEVASSAVPDAGTCRVAETSVHHDAALIAALGPDAARLLADMADEIERLTRYDDGEDCGAEACPDCAPGRRRAALLDRLGALGA